MIEKINNNKALKIIAMLFKTIVSFFIIIVISSLVLILYIKENRKKKCACKQGARKRR